jgi:hypothetical protein
VMAQAGHSDQKQTLGIYASVIASGTDHGATMDELVHKDVWARKGTNAEFEGLAAEGATTPQSEIPADSGDFGEAADGIRTHDLLHGKQTL